MAALLHDIEIEEGTTFSYIITIQNRNETTNVVTPIDLTGFTARSMIKPDYRSTSTAIASFTCTIEDATAGKIRMELPATTTASLVADIDKPETVNGLSYQTFTIGFYDLEVENETGHVSRLLRGKVTYSDEITV